MSESVMVVNNRLISPIINIKDNGCLITGNDQVFDNIIENHSFMPRSEAEYNFDFKQVIPYVIIRNVNEYLLLKRTSRQTEKRLHNKYSLGIGGHINPAPSIPEENLITNGLYKELGEEILLDDPGKLRFIGVINDEGNSVSRVHLGLLYLLETISSKYQILESEKMTAQWVAKDRLIDFYDNLETWSQIVYDNYIL